MMKKKKGEVSIDNERGPLVSPWTSEHVAYLNRVISESDFTLVEIARKSRVGFSTIKGWKQGKTTPHLENLKQVEAVLKCSLREPPPPETTTELIGFWKGVGNDCAPWDPNEEKDRDTSVALAKKYCVQFQIEQKISLVSRDTLAGVSFFQTIATDTGQVVSPWSAYDVVVRVYGGDQLLFTFAERPTPARPQQDIGGGILQRYKMWPSFGLRGFFIATEYQLHPKRKPPALDGCEIVRLSMQKITAESHLEAPWHEVGETGTPRVQR